MCKPSLFAEQLVKVGPLIHQCDTEFCKAISSWQKAWHHTALPRPGFPLWPLASGFWWFSTFSVQDIPQDVSRHPQCVLRRRCQVPVDRGRVTHFLAGLGTVGIYPRHWCHWWKAHPDSKVGKFRVWVLQLHEVFDHTTCSHSRCGRKGVRFYSVQHMWVNRTYWNWACDIPPPLLPLLREPLLHNTIVMLYYLVAGDAFRVTTKCIKPYRHRGVPY